MNRCCILYSQGYVSDPLLLNHSRIVAPKPANKSFSLRSAALPVICFKDFNNSRLYGKGHESKNRLGLTKGFRVFPWLALNFYLKDNLQVNPGTLQFLQHTVNLPMVAKPIYGIVSDAVYFKGAHRLPYVFIGALLQAFSWGFIALSPVVGSSITVLTVFLILSNLGASIVEVANDALVAECGKMSRGKVSGQLQSFTWMAMSAGSLMGNLIAAFLVSQAEPKTMFLIFLSLLGIQLWTSMHLREESFGVSRARNPNPSFARYPTPKTTRKHILSLSLPKILGLECKQASLSKSIKSQFTEMTELVKRPEISVPLVWFAASYAATPLLSGTMFFYHTQHLKMKPSTLGLAKVVGQMSLLLGSFVYDRFLKKLPMRKLICCVQILLAVCMLGDIFLVKQLNIQVGISNEAYVIAASAFVEALAQFKVLPFTVLLAQLCPVGCEGSLMAFFMSVQCFSSIVSGYMGVVLAAFLRVSPDNYSRLPLGIFIQSMATLLPLMWISYVPDAKLVLNPALQH